MSAPLSNLDNSTITEQLLLRLKIPTKLRNLEAALILFAMVITSFALALVDLGATGKLNVSIIGLSLGLGAIVLALHVAQRFVARDADPLILPIVTLLNGLGIAMIHRLDIANGLTGWQSQATRQMVWTAIAIVVAIAVIVVVRNHRVLQRYRYLWMAAGIFLLLLPLVPFIGVTINGARLWVNLGIVSFQPGEIGKIALALFFAGYLVTARDSLSMVGKKFLGVRWPQFKDLGPIFVVWMVAMMVLIFQRDMGTSLLYFGLFLVLMYVATGRAIWFVVGGGLFGAGAFVASRFLTYVEGRFTAWLDSFNPAVYEAVGGSYQLVQGLFGFASGGVIGTGFGAGHPSIVPLAESDYIVASLGEELGLVGIFAILSLYLLFISRGMRIGINGADDFGRLLAVGLTFVIALQVFIVIGGVTRVIPVTGLTTPFLAAGGSSLVANWIIVALLLRLSDTVRHQRDGGDAT
jgi:cell division protein FtsW (lipid II flippase)